LSIFKSNDSLLIVNTQQYILIAVNQEHILAGFLVFALFTFEIRFRST